MTINCKGKLLNFDSPIVMGILNVTPDSFYDGGNYLNPEQILERAHNIISQGGTFIDIGGYSSKPGAEDVSEEEELARVIPAIDLIIKEIPEALISIDTFRSKVALKAVEAGACMVNDISAGELDPTMFTTLRTLQVPYCIMHMQGTPQTMQQNPTYQNVVTEVYFYLAKKIEELSQLGVNDVIIDLGFGFGKTIQQNYKLLHELSYFTSLNKPILSGVSRKSMIYKTLNISPEESLNGTTTLNSFSLMNGANILRVHDVAEAIQTIKLYTKLTHHE